MKIDISKSQTPQIMRIENKTCYLTTSLDSFMMRKLAREAKRLGLPKSALIRALIHQYLYDNQFFKDKSRGDSHIEEWNAVEAEEKAKEILKQIDTIPDGWEVSKKGWMPVLAKKKSKT